MEYSVQSVSGEPKFDSLGVIKLRCAPAIDINSRIYAQAQVGRSQSCIYVRIWSFETSPTDSSEVCALFSNGKDELSLCATFGEQATASLNGKSLPDTLTAYLISGEDLQGEYWGAVMMFPIKRFFDIFGISEASLPATIGGNILRKNPELSSAVPLNEQLKFVIK